MNGKSKVHWPLPSESPGIQIFGKEEPVKIRGLTGEHLLAFGVGAESNRHEVSSGRIRFDLNSFSSTGTFESVYRISVTTNHVSVRSCSMCRALVPHLWKILRFRRQPSHLLT